MKPVQFNSTLLRDAHQSLAATRMSTAQMLPILDKLDAVGYGRLETWGGASIDAGLRFLKEFPFDRLDALRAKTKTPHIMLMRGQNIVAYNQCPDDVVAAFATQSVRHGMNTIRIFDALNDPRNMRTAIEATKKAGGEAQGTICYTNSPVHTVEGFIKLGCILADMGVASLCLKDMAGLVSPRAAYDIIKGLKDNLKLPVFFHTHETTGLGASSYLAAIDAGVDFVDVAIRPFSDGTAHPDHTRMMALLKGHPRCPNYDQKLIDEISEYEKGVYEALSKFTSHKNEVVNIDALRYEVPGGMLSNFRNQLKELKMEDKFEEVCAEIPYIREKLGWIPLVTPTSQIVGTQAAMNVKFGRWKQFIPGAMDIALGYFGQTPAPVDPEIQKLAAQRSKKAPITCRPADLLKPRMEEIRKELKKNNLPTNDEHCVIYAMFPQQVKELYFPKEEAPKPAPAPVAIAVPATGPAVAISARADFSGSVTSLAMSVNGTLHNVRVEEID